METVTTERNALIEKDIEITDDDLPMGQRLLKEGFKEITVEQMYKIFACKAITTKLRQDFLDEIEKQYKVKYSEIKFSSNYNSSDNNSSYFLNCIKNDFYISYVIKISKGWFGKIIKARKSENVYFNKQCIVKVESIDGYMGDIPEQALKNMKIAKDIGIKEFRVYYPAIESVPQKDPVLVGVIPNLNKNETLIEIYYWE